MDHCLSILGNLFLQKELKKNSEKKPQFLLDCLGFFNKALTVEEHLNTDASAYSVYCLRYLAWCKL